jgi:hypothetical protein
MPTNTIPPCPSPRIAIRQGFRLEHEQRFGADQFTPSESAHERSLKHAEHVAKMRASYDEPLPATPPGETSPPKHADT